MNMINWINVYATMYVCVVCVRRMCASYVCVVCVRRMCASYVCVVYVRRMCVPIKVFVIRIRELKTTYLMYSGLHKRQ